MIPPGQIFLIGDSHIGLKDGNEEKVVRWLDRLSALKPRSLYLNGDVFHYLIGHPNFFTHSVEKVFEKLGELKRGGVSIHYVEGNRDFFLKGSKAESSVTEVVTEAAFEVAGKRYFVIHGDMINDRDMPYRFWRLASKNPITRFAVGLIPKGPATRFVDRVEKRLARSNFKHKRRLPIELMEAYGRMQAERGVDVVVFGHFHHKTIVPAGKATVAVLPAWYESGEAMMVSPENGRYEFVVI